MSYVDLKHLLADLTLDAVRAPSEASWAAVVAAYAELATAEQPEIPWSRCRDRAAGIGAPDAWAPDVADARHLKDRGLFADRRGDRIVLADRFLPHLAYVRRHGPRLLAALAELRRTAAPPQVPDQIRVGAALFNAGLFFECHEWLEEVWKATPGDPKDFYHGIVQAAAAFYHYEKHNTHGGRTLLRKGRRRLAPYPGAYLGVDLERFRSDLAEWATHLEGGARPGDLPHVYLLTGQMPGEEAEGAPRG